MQGNEISQFIFKQLWSKVLQRVETLYVDKLVVLKSLVLSLSYTSFDF